MWKAEFNPQHPCSSEDAETDPWGSLASRPSKFQISKRACPKKENNNDGVCRMILTSTSGLCVHTYIHEHAYTHIYKTIKWKEERKEGKSRSNLDGSLSVASMTTSSVWWKKRPMTHPLCSLALLIAAYPKTPSLATNLTARPYGEG